MRYGKLHWTTVTFLFCKAPQNALGRFCVFQLFQELLLLKSSLCLKQIYKLRSVPESRLMFPFIMGSVKSFTGSVRFSLAMENHSLHVFSACFLWSDWLEVGKLLSSWGMKRLVCWCWSAMPNDKRVFHR